jgi:hypothetical protein
MDDDEFTPIPDTDRLIEEGGGWQKPVAPPKADTRPAGLPPAPQPSPTSRDK